MQEIGLHDCGNWLGKSEICTWGRQEGLAGNSGRRWCAELLLSQGNLISTQSFNLVDQPTQIMEDNPLYLKSADCRCKPYLRNIFTATLSLVLDQVTEDWSLAKLTHTTDHHTLPLKCSLGLMTWQSLNTYIEHDRKIDCFFWIFWGNPRVKYLLLNLRHYWL